MIQITIDQTIFQHYVPAFENSDEYVFERMSSFLEDAKAELNQLMDGKEYWEEVAYPLRELSAKYVCLEAAYRAIPQMDLVLTDNGFGVVSTNNVAPASKDRVAALTDKLRKQASTAWDKVVECLLKSSWRETPKAVEMVSNLIYLPSQLFTKFQYKGNAVYREEFAEIYPKLMIAASKVKQIISKELYEELLVRERMGINQAAYEITRSRAINYMVAFLGDMPLADLKKILIDTIEALADALPEYLMSSTYRARHSSGYENRQSDAVFFMS